MRHATLLVLALASVTAACAADADDSSTGTQEADQKVRPSGPNGRGTVTVNIPSWVQPTFTKDGKSYRYTFSFNGTQLEPGKPTLVVPTTTEGNWGCLEINLSGANAITKQRECIWQLPSGGTLTIDLGVAKVWWSGFPRVHVDFAVDEPGTPFVARTWQDKWYFAQAGHVGTNDLPLLLVPGDYVYGVQNRVFREKPFKVVAGQQTDMNADYNEFLSHAKLTYEAAEYPDAISGTPLRCANGRGEKRMSAAGNRWTHYQVMLDRPSVDCELLFANGRLAVPFKLDGAGQTTTMALGRIDVDDVMLADEGNRTVAGTWNVRRKEGDQWGAWLLAKEAPTKRGIDLPTGTYEVAVTYASAVGNKILWHTVDVP